MSKVPKVNVTEGAIVSFYQKLPGIPYETIMNLSFKKENENTG